MSDQSKSWTTALGVFTLLISALTLYFNHQKDKAEEQIKELERVEHDRSRVTITTATLCRIPLDSGHYNVALCMVLSNSGTHVAAGLKVETVELVDDKRFSRQFVGTTTRVIEPNASAHISAAVNHYENATRAVVLGTISYRDLETNAPYTFNYCFDTQQVETTKAQTVSLVECDPGAFEKRIPTDLDSENLPLRIQ